MKPLARLLYWLGWRPYFAIGTRGRKRNRIVCARQSVWYKRLYWRFMRWLAIELDAHVRHAPPEYGEWDIIG